MLTPEETALYTAQLVEARSVRHRLLTMGGVVKTMSRSGDSMQETQWTPAKLGDLERYIAELERILGLSTSLRRERSRQVVF